MVVGKLFQYYAIDVYVEVEASRVNYIKKTSKLCFSEKTVSKGV
jgi:hypothetical protein